MDVQALFDMGLKGGLCVFFLVYICVGCFAFSPSLPFMCSIFPWVEMYSQTQNPVCCSGDKVFINEYTKPLIKAIIK